jgi:predicted 3-demethylubiquinone-9 3-methyltransferase (glyoxalase superfamily)
MLKSGKELSLPNQQAQGATMVTVTPNLWYNNNAEEAAEFYVSVFDTAEITNTIPGGPDGKALVVSMSIEGQNVTFINGGPMFPQTEAFSFEIICDGQAEVDRYWDALIADGGAPSQCGWLKDKFGLSWQVVPKQFLELVSDPDAEKVGRVMSAMMEMIKLDVAELEKAAEAA